MPAFFGAFRGSLGRALRVRASRLSSGAMVEPGFVTLTKIIGTLLFCMGIIPFLFLLAPGDRSEPKDSFDGD
jgi:hypothetical protein